MSIPIHDFWRLLVESRLAMPDQARQLQQMFGQVTGGDEARANSAALAQWMTSNGLLSLYQAKVLLSGRSGPFVFGDYLLYDRFEPDRFKSVFRAVHLPTRGRALVAFHTGPLTQIEREWLNVVQQTARFRHANHAHLSRVVQLIDLGQYKFTVMEDLEGQSAAQRLADGPIPWSQACKIGQQVASGLSRLADLKLLHGEICPANIWIDPHGDAKLLLPPLAHDPSVIPGPIDFLEPDPSGRMLMLADYSAPELGQATQSGQEGGRPTWQTEIYALGCTLYHLMAGRAPYTGDDVSSKLMQHATAEPVAPLESFGVPPWAAHVVSQMMDKDVTRRFQTPQQVVSAFGAVLEPPAAAPAAETAPTAAIVPELPPTQLLPPLDMSTSAAPAAAMPHAPTAVEFPPLDVDAENIGLFDAIAAPPGRNKRPRKNGGLPLATIVLLLCAIGGLAFLASTAMKKEVKSKPGAMPAGEAKAPADADSAKAVDESAADILNSSAATTSTQRASEGADAPAAAVGAAPTQVERPIKPAAGESQQLWASPTYGTPISLDYVPPGAQAFLVLRPAELLQHAEGEKLMAGLGPYGQNARQDLEAMAGAPLEEIEQLTVAWVERMGADSASTIAPLYVIRFAKAANQDKLKATWNHAASSVHAGEEVFATPTGSAYLPSAERGKLLVAGATEEVLESAEQGRVAPPLRIAIEKMLLNSDAGRQMIFLFAPSFLYQQSKYFFPGELDTLLPPLRALLPDDFRAAMLSAHLTKDDFFIEFCALGPIGQSPASVAQQLRRRIAMLPEATQKNLTSLNVQTYGKQILLRYPEMVRVLDQFTRAGTHDDQAVLRSYLPVQAAHNLLMGSELALAESAGASAAAGIAGTGTPQRETVAQKLQHVTSLVFARETLEKALQLLGDDIGVKIEILGGDLQLEGITKNQSFALDEKNHPAVEILRKIMLQANPDGKLVYVVKPREPGGQEILFITTRNAVKKRGDTLPPEFAAPKGK